MPDYKMPVKKYGKKTKRQERKLQLQRKWQKRNLLLLEIVLFVVIVSLGISGYIYYKHKENAEIEMIIQEAELTEAEHQVIEVEEPMPYEIKEKYSSEMFNERYTKLHLYYLAGNIYVESKHESDYKQRAVGSVALNREKGPNFPNNLIDVFEQRGQYAGMIEGTAQRIIEIFENNEPISEELFLELERCIENAEWLLENGSILDEEYVYQATFKQGYDCIYIEGDWFGKERR